MMPVCRRIKNSDFLNISRKIQPCSSPGSFPSGKHIGIQDTTASCDQLRNSLESTKIVAFTHHTKLHHCIPARARKGFNQARSCAGWEERALLKDNQFHHSLRTQAVWLPHSAVVCLGYGRDTRTHCTLH